MARFTNGWVKIHRSLLEERWNGPIGSILMRLILIANYEDGKPFMRRGKLIVIRRGQLITSLTELALDLDLNRKTIRRYIEILTNMGTITSKMDNRGYIITLCNYNKYQDVGPADWPAEGTPDWPAEGTRIEKVKKLRIKEGVAQALPTPDLERFLFAYEQAFLTKYTFTPIVNRAGRAAAKRVIADLGLEAACKLVEAYLKIGNDPYFYSRSYDLVTFEANILAIQKFVETKSHMTLIELKAIERDAKKGPKL